MRQTDKYLRKISELRLGRERISALPERAT
jgi:hypothetical protein